MKRIISLLVLLALANISFSQDVIMKKNGDEIKSKVEELTDEVIKYKKFDNLEGPSYSIPKSEVFIIKYSNGTKEVIEQSSGSSASPSSSPSTDNTFQNVTVQEAPKGSPRIELDGGKYYQYNRRLSENMLGKVLQESNKKDAIGEFKAGKTLSQIGRPFIIAGIPITIVGVVGLAIGGLLISELSDTSISSVGSTIFSVGITAGSVGIASITTGIVLNSIGNGKTKKAIALYNEGL